VTQATAGNQPQIVASGVVTRFNGQVGINFTTDDRLFRIGGIFSGAGARSIFTVYRPNNSAGSFSYNIFGQAGSTTTGTWSMIQARTLFVTGDPYFAGYGRDIGNGLSSVTTLQKLASFTYDGTTGYLYRNGTLLGSANITLAANLATARIMVGAGFTSNFEEHADAVIQECIAYASDQASNRSGIETNIKAFFGL
jgi:hypothetical protein